MHHRIDVEVAPKETPSDFLARCDRKDRLYEMFHFERGRPGVWPAHLQPIGFGDHEVESFEDWWLRHQDELSHLPPELCEQWIYKHWFQSSFAFLPLNTLTCETIEMTAAEILTQVHRELAVNLDPEFDLRVLGEPRMGRVHPTGAAFAELNTWDYPIVVLRTPSGFRGFDIEDAAIRLVLVEGHQRHRYLNALNHFGNAPNGPHKLLAISSPLVR